MSAEDKAKIIAFAKLFGLSGSDSEILDKYCEYYQEALNSLKEPAKPAKVEVIQRPF